MRKTVYIVTIEDSGELKPLYTSDIRDTIPFDEKLEAVINRYKVTMKLLSNNFIGNLYDSLITNRVLQGLLDNIDNPVKNIIWDYQIHEIELER